MNNSPIDILLQLPVPRVEPAPAGARPRDESSAFDSHFRQASHPDTTSPPAPAAQSSRRSTDSAHDSIDSANDKSPPSPTAPTTSQTQSKAPADSAPTSETTSNPPTDDEARSSDSDREVEAANDSATAALAAQQAAANRAAESATASVSSDDPVASPTDAPADAASSGDEPQPGKKEAKASPRSVRAAADSQQQSEKPAAELARRDEPSEAASESAKNRGEKPATVDHPEAEAPAKPADASPIATEATDDTKAPRSKNRREDSIEAKPAPSATTSQDPAARPIATHDKSDQQSAAPKASHGEPSGDTASRKGDKKISTRGVATPAEVSSPPAERPPAVTATADSPPAPAAASTPLPAANVATSSSPNSTTKPQDTPSGKQGFLSPFARLERGAHSARGTNQAGSPDSPRRVDPARFVSRVARAIHTAQERGGPLQLRLSPPELGAMRLELSLQQGTLTATIETENSATRQLLLDNLPALRDRLAEQNVKIERFDVDVRRDPSGNHQNTAPQDRGHGDTHSRASGRNSVPRSTSTQASIEEPLPVRRAITSTSINVVA